MDFDEYEYLEKTVENPELSKGEATPATANGNGIAAEEKGHGSSRSKGRGEELDRDSERRSKRVKSEEDRHSHRDREKDRERGSSRHRSSPDHKERDRDRERRRSSREERDRKDRDRDNDRERDRERTRDRDHDREREKERDRDRERSHRSRSRSERHQEEEVDRNRERSKDRERREREREREREKERELREKERENRRYKDKKEEAAEPEADPERDQRTVFAYQINLKADERDVYEFFSRAGKVRDVRLIMDRNSRRSKGVGYIEFYDAMSVPMAIALTGQKLLGQAVMVKPSEAEKNLVQSTASGAAGVAGAQSSGARKLYVGNLHFNITEDQLRQVFEPFGTVELVQLPLDPETGHCKGFGFIQFARLEDAKAAQSLNGQLEIAGRTIKVSAVTDQVGAQDTGTNAGDLDDDEGGGLSLNAHSRALLMQKLDRSGIATSAVTGLTTPAVNPVLPIPAASVLGITPAVSPLVQSSLPGLVGLPGSGLPVATAVPPVDPIGIPSECLLLKNMFDPSVETEPDFDLDIKEDVQDECSKFGNIKHIFVEKNSAGFVYLRFNDVTSAINAQRALHGRWFAGKMITATFMLPQNYDARFPGSGGAS